MAAVATVAMTPSCKSDEATLTIVPSTSATELISLLATAPISADANIDASWDGCNKLTTNTAEVSDTTLFAKQIYQLFMGKTQNFTIRSQYDAKNIYFLVEVEDATKSTDNRAYGYNPSTSAWEQPAAISKTTLPAEQFGQDQIGFIFPINDNTTWDKKTCYSTCHIGELPKYGNHYTSKLKDAADPMTGFGADIWFWRSVGTAPTNQSADGFITTDSIAVAGSKAARGGRVTNDDTGKTTYAYTANKDTMSVGGKKIAKPSVKQVFPSYVLVKATGVPAIRVADITSGDAVKVDSVSSLGNGKLYLHNGTVIDPVAESAKYNYLTGTNKIPTSIVRGPLTGSSGDIPTYANYANGKWIIKIIRPLLTTDPIKQDVQFNIAKPLMFGFATIDNANNQHLVKANLKLSFAAVAAQ